MGYEIVDHTADVGIRAWGATLDKLLVEAAKGMFAVMGSAGDGPVTRAEVRIEADDLEGLMERWLSELLYVFEVKNIVPVRVQVHVDPRRCTLRGVIEGTPGEAFEQTGPAVKAVTYHGMRVAESPEGWEARVYLDV